jgi:hypothetical protein
MLGSFESSKVLLGVDDGPDAKKNAKDMPDFITDFLKNPNNKTVNPTRLIMWYRLLAYENRLYRLFMILGLIPVDIDFDAIKNHQILEILKPYILETFDENVIKDLKQCFDRGLNSFFICLVKHGKFQINGQNVFFIPGKFDDAIIKDNVDPKNNNNNIPNKDVPSNNKPINIPINDPVINTNPNGIIVPQGGIQLNANILPNQNQTPVVPNSAQMTNSGTVAPLPNLPPPTNPQ